MWCRRGALHTSGDRCCRKGSGLQRHIQAWINGGSGGLWRCEPAALIRQVNQDSIYLPVSPAWREGVAMYEGVGWWWVGTAATDEGGRSLTAP